MLDVIITLFGIVLIILVCFLPPYIIYYIKKKELDNIYNNYVKGQCYCSNIIYEGYDLRHLGAEHIRDARKLRSRPLRKYDKYIFVFDYYIGNVKYQTRRGKELSRGGPTIYDVPTDPQKVLRQGEYTELWVNPNNYHQTFIPKFDNNLRNSRNTLIFMSVVVIIAVIALIANLLL